MKVRTCFVSNSSSSSFIVIGDSVEQTFESYNGDLRRTDTIIIGRKIGETEFGWGPEKIKDAGSKINFAYLQATYNLEHMEMLMSVLREYFDEIGIELSSDYNSNYFGYIDHQSSACEGENLEMFESEGTLIRFLFNKGSYIQLDNDNH